MKDSFELFFYFLFLVCGHFQRQQWGYHVETVSGRDGTGRDGVFPLCAFTLSAWVGGRRAAIFFLCVLTFGRMPR